MMRLRLRRAIELASALQASITLYYSPPKAKDGGKGETIKQTDELKA